MKHLLRLLCVGMALHFSLSTLHSAHAQGSAFVATRQQMTNLPGNAKNVSVVDGELYCFSSGVLFKAQRRDGQVLACWADTDFVKFSEDIEYVVKHPVTGDLYFTKRDRKGRSFLYCCSSDSKVRQVNLGGKIIFDKGMTVEHPTFSSDGSVLIFTSYDKEHGIGGYDLWYSRLIDGEWSKPSNFGNRINTKGDEVSPCVYRDYLLFSSDGHKDDNGHLTLYSTRLFIEKVGKDEAPGLQLGRCMIQRLPIPLNSNHSDDFDMAIDTLSGYGYWVSRRVASEADSQLYAFQGTIDAVALWGMVRDKDDRPIQGVKVTASLGKDEVCSAFTGKDGIYRLYLQGGHSYDLSYRLDHYFETQDILNTTAKGADQLVAEMRRDVRLDSLPIGRRIYFSDIFGPGVDVELSSRGIELLEPLVRFLNDNPTLRVSMSLVNDLTDDCTFNSLLTDQRILTLQKHLFPLLPSTVKIGIANGCGKGDNCCESSGKSRLTVLISKPL